MLLTKAQLFIENNYSLTACPQSDFERMGVLTLGKKTSSFSDTCCSQTDFSSGLEVKPSANVHPIDTKLLEEGKQLGIKIHWM